MQPPASSRLLVSCARGVAPYLRREILGLGLPALAEPATGVETEGTPADVQRLNLCLRTGQRVLALLLDFRAERPDALYERLRHAPWEDHIPEDGYLTVTSFVRTPAVRDPRYVNVRAKDAIVDRIREARGRRPDSGNERRGAVVFIYWQGASCRVYLDTSGEGLSRRGYRKIPMAAPLPETLAAAVVTATGWDGGAHFVNPMCGSGTLAIEAALLGLGRAPGLLRRDFGFRHLRGFDEAAWRAVRAEIQRRPRRRLGGRIIATDLNPGAVAAARQNARTAGVEQVIEFGVCDFADTPVPEGGGVVVLNPGYGRRLGQEADLAALYGRIGDFFKQRCLGYAGHVFTGNLALAKRIGLRSRRRIRFFNGEVECRLLAFELYAGTRRRFAAAPDATALAGEGPAS
jgi:putative N6-adenine-specific DNA methylase